MDITTLENYLWEAACSIRGPIDAPKFIAHLLFDEDRAETSEVLTESRRTVLYFVWIRNTR